jgi:uncharacterized protein YdcH (DUF465 family)
MKLQTVNVIEITNGIIQGLTSYPETPEGNKAAEEHFGRLLKEHNAETDDVIEQAIEDGTYTDGSGYEVNLVHST